jgi:hypothetical protein
MSYKLMIGLMLLAGLLNFLPLAGLFSVTRMQTLYGVDLSDPNLAIFMRHRALLFGIVGGFILCAAFMPALQPAAFVMGFVSMLGFIALAWLTGGYNSGINKLVLLDWVGVSALALALLLYLQLV